MGRKHDKKEEASIILEILNRIPLSKRFVSVDDILNSLASAEIDVSRRSLQRYLKQMYDCFRNAQRKRFERQRKSMAQQSLRHFILNSSDAFKGSSENL